MQKPSFPKYAGSLWKTIIVSNTVVEDEALEEVDESNTSATQEDTVEALRASQEYHDTTALLFPEWIRKLVADEQFGKCIKVIKKLYVNITLLDAMQFPMYAKYIMDKDPPPRSRTLPTTMVV